MAKKNEIIVKDLVIKTIKKTALTISALLNIYYISNMLPNVLYIFSSSLFFFLLLLLLLSSTDKKNNKDFINQSFIY